MRKTFNYGEDANFTRLADMAWQFNMDYYGEDFPMTKQEFIDTYASDPNAESLLARLCSNITLMVYDRIRTNLMIKKEVAMNRIRRSQLLQSEAVRHRILTRT